MITGIKEKAIVVKTINIVVLLLSIEKYDLLSGPPYPTISIHMT